MAPAALVVPINISVKLPAVWLTNIAACFIAVEGIFELRHIISQ
jgi:hypothetical protein